MIGLSFAGFAGQYSIVLAGLYIRGTLTNEGLFTINGGNLNGRNTQATVSDNQVDFPSSGGWYKIMNLVSDGTWDYFKFKDDGSLEILHFSSNTDDGCSATHGTAAVNYCSIGTGRIESGTQVYIHV